MTDNVSGVSELIQRFRSNSELDDIDHEFISELGKFSDRSLPARFAEQQNFISTNESDSGTTLSLKDDIENIQQFYNWIDSLEGETGTKEDETYRFLLPLKIWPINIFINYNN